MGGNTVEELRETSVVKILFGLEVLSAVRDDEGREGDTEKGESEKVVVNVDLKLGEDGGRGRK